MISAAFCRTPLWIMHGLADTTVDVLNALHRATRWIVAESSIPDHDGDARHCQGEQPVTRNPEYG